MKITSYDRLTELYASYTSGTVSLEKVEETLSLEETYAPFTDKSSTYFLTTTYTTVAKYCIYDNFCENNVTCNPDFETVLRNEMGMVEDCFTEVTDCGLDDQISALENFLNVTKIDEDFLRKTFQKSDLETRLFIYRVIF